MCRNPDQCAAQAQSLANAMQQWAPVGQAELMKWRAAYKAYEGDVVMKHHGYVRCEDREFTPAEIMEAMMNGKVIERFQRRWQRGVVYKTGRPPVEVNLLISYELPIAEGEQAERRNHRQSRSRKRTGSSGRYVHISVVFPPGSMNWTITTVYRPTDKEWRWNNDYTSRQCWC